MSVSNRYVLDANPFIEAKNRYYGFDICPGFWTSLVTQHEAKRVFSIDRIRDELVQQDDEIKQWIEDRAPQTFFKKTEVQAVVDVFQRMMNWVYSEVQFTDAAKTEFASVADGWVIAYAVVNGLIVVTHEEYAPDAKRKVPIPNVCIEFDVEYVNTFEMLRDLRERFVRSTKRNGKQR
ncbi:MAG: DUF4411 family protein [Planctomycetota bacterium]